MVANFFKIVSKLPHWVPWTAIRTMLCWLKCAQTILDCEGPCSVWHDLVRHSTGRLLFRSCKDACLHMGLSKGRTRRLATVQGVSSRHLAGLRPFLPSQSTAGAMISSGTERSAIRRHAATCDHREAFLGGQLLPIRWRSSDRCLVLGISMSQHLDFVRQSNVLCLTCLRFGNSEELSRVETQRSGNQNIQHKSCQSKSPKHLECCILRNLKKL